MRPSLANLFLDHHRRWYAGLLAALLIALLPFGFSRTDPGRSLEERTADLRFRYLPISARADTGIVLVAIDNSSLEFFAANGISWPWPRDFYAHVTDYLTAAGARSILFDILFYEADLEREETSAAETDGAFARALRASGRGLLAVELTDGPPTPDISRFSLPGDFPDPERFPEYAGAIVPIPPLREAAVGLGVINVRPDPDGVLRGLPLFYRLRDDLYPQFALIPLLRDLPAPVLEGTTIQLGPHAVPVDRSGSYRLNWYGEGGPEGPFRYLPFSALIQSAAALQTGGTPSLPTATFAGKHVLIGATASGLFDARLTPVGILPGMEVWATVISNILRDDYLTVPPAWSTYLNTVAVAFVTFLLFTRLSPLPANLLLWLSPFGFLGIALYLWNGHRTLVEIVPPLLGFGLSYLYTAIASYLSEGRARRQIRGIFGRYVHPAVIDRMLLHPEQIAVGGSELEATVLFSDISDFTCYSEDKPASALVHDLNEYFDRLAAFVLDHDGLLDKYTGDGIMAIFGAPLSRADHALIACKAALAHRAYGRQLDADTPPAHFHRNTRLGINSGRIVTGNIGSARRMDYTAIGDEVNLASRLEGLNKIYGTRIIISQSTHDLVADRFTCRELDRVRVKGRHHPTSIYELVEERVEEWDVSPEERARIDRYHRALERYRNGDWQEALEEFTALTAPPLADPPSAIMAQRCSELIAAPPSAWDGIFTLETK